MGGSDLPQADSIGSLFANLEAKVAMQATSQGLGNSKVQGGATEYTDANGNETINQGTYTYLTGPWAGVTLRGSTIYFDPMGNPIMVIGPQPDGKTGIGMYNPAGTRLQFMDFTGLTSSDTAGNSRCINGQLPNGDFGLAVYDRSNSGAYQEVLPVSIAVASGTTAVTSTTYVHIGPDVSASIGASGAVIIRSSGNIATSAGGQTGKGAVVIDGVVATTYAEIALSTSASGGAQVDMSTAQKVTGLTPGAHTFAFYAAQTGGVSINVGTPSVEVQPL